MVLRTYFDRNNTLIYNNKTNVGRNPVTELYYGGTGSKKSYTRLIFQFDETRIKELYDNKTYLAFCTPTSNKCSIAVIAAAV